MLFSVPAYCMRRRTSRQHIGVVVVRATSGWPRLSSRRLFGVQVFLRGIIDEYREQLCQRGVDIHRSADVRVTFHSAERGGNSVINVGALFKRRLLAIAPKLHRLSRVGVRTAQMVGERVGAQVLEQRGSDDAVVVLDTDAEHDMRRRRRRSVGVRVEKLGRDALKVALRL